VQIPPLALETVSLEDAVLFAEDATVPTGFEVFNPEYTSHFNIMLGDVADHVAKITGVPVSPVM
jgi:hypothetical protein